MSHKKGFTLLEILLVVGIIAILTGIVILAINPARQLAQTRNAERVSNLKQINNAILQYYIDNNVFPSDVSTTTLTEICDTGSATSTTVFPAGYCDDLTDLTPLVPTYVVSMPVDPQGSIAFLDNLITKVFAATNGTGYYVMAEDNKVILIAPLAELGEVIAIGTTTVSTDEEPEATYTLTFDSQGGTTVEPITDITSGATTTLPSDPTREGYTFEGWNTQADGNGDSFTNTTPVIANITVYAVWAVNSYTLTFDSAGGSAVAPITQDYGTSITPPANPIRQYYIFSDWSPALPATMPLGGGTYTAQWSENFTVPGAPTIGTATAGNATATVAFSAPASNGGSAITGYTVTSSPAGGTDTNAGTTGTNHLITGLTNETAYTFTVTATNAVGTGPASAASDPVTPTAPVVATCEVSGDTTDPDCWSPQTISGLRWSTEYINTSADSTTNGKTNTAALFALSGSYPAAEYCYNLTEGDVPVGTWYLPANDQIVSGLTTYQTQYWLGNPNWAGFNNWYYWSSTEYSISPFDRAWFAYSNDEVSVVGNYYAKKDSTAYRVRCLR